MRPDDAAAPGDAPSLRDVWTLWAAVGYAALLLLAALGVAFGWTALEDALDVRRWFH